MALAAGATWPLAGRREHPPHRPAAVERALERGRALRVRRAQRAATRATVAGAERARVSGGPPASTASAWAISAPPEDGGGFVTNTRSR